MSLQRTIGRLLGAGVLTATALAGCRGTTSSQPPIHVQLNMDHQRRLEAQESFGFFSDGRAMRPRVEGTVPRGALYADDHLYRGRDDAGGFAATLPSHGPDGKTLALDEKFLAHGQTRYQIFCSPCHDATGHGDGLVGARGMVRPPSLYDPRIMAMPVGQYFDIISNGVNNMPSYRVQIPPKDRWAIAAYVRTLQISRAGK